MERSREYQVTLRGEDVRKTKNELILDRAAAAAAAAAILPLLIQ